MRTYHLFTAWRNNKDLVLKKTGRDFMLLYSSLLQLEASEPGQVFSMAVSQKEQSQLSPPQERLCRAPGYEARALESMSSDCLGYNKNMVVYQKYG